jgi:hypothetical protein
VTSRSDWACIRARSGGPCRGVARRPARGLLDPYRPLVDQLLGEGVWNAMVIRGARAERGEAVTEQ